MAGIFIRFLFHVDLFMFNDVRTYSASFLKV